VKTGTDRPWRKYRSSAALFAIAALLACAPGAAQAATGGAGTTASNGAQPGGGLAFTSLRWAGATWYGPGLYGRSTACGQKLRPGLLGVAHRNLPCGTPVKFVYRGRQVVTRVIDRGPYSHGNDWDLTLAAARILRFERVGRDHVGFALSRKFARKLRAKRRSSR